jgi:DNA modification methylase
MGHGRIHHPEFAMASGEMSTDEFRSFLSATLANAVHVSRDGALHFVCMDWRHLEDLFAAVKGVYAEMKNLIVWSKTNAGQGSLYRSQHELIGLWKVGEASHMNNVELGRYGRSRSNIWVYAGVNTFKAGRDQELAAHPTTKPVALVADAIKDVTKRGGIVLDPFLGSGTTLIAAEKTGRRCRAMEIAPRYVDVAIRRFEKFTGKDAVHVETGRSYSELAGARHTVEAVF